MAFLAPLDIGLIMGLIFSWGVISLSLSFRLFNFPDLTIEGSLPLGAAVYAIMLQKSVSMPVAICSAVLIGALAGIITALLHLKFKLNKFLSGIIVVAISYSLCLRIMGASNIGLINFKSLFDLVTPMDRIAGKSFHIGKIILLTILLIISSIVIIKYLSSRDGMRLRVAGSCPEYAHSLGINVTWKVALGLAFTNGMAAFSGVLLTMHQGFADVGMGQGILILALASMTLGERIIPDKSLPYHIFVLTAGILGSILYQTLVAFAIRLGLAPTDLKLVTAVLVLLVVTFRISRNTELYSEVFK
jgi:putative tryptophan/tyrosine transport system permease protein